MNSTTSTKFAALLTLAFAFIPSGAFAQNLIVNGDFGAGNTGFESDYTYTTFNGAPGHTQYTVSADPSSWNSAFLAPPVWSDHTPNSDNLSMLVNGSITAGLDFWRETLTLQPNTQYTMSGWVSSLDTGSDPNLTVIQLDVDGTVIASPYNVVNGSPNWQQFQFAFDTGSSAQVTVALLDSSTALYPNDFAIDDLSLEPVPEPAVASLAGLGFAFVILRRCRRC